MNRIVQEDFQKLLHYFSEYTLSNVAADTGFQNNAKSIHRKLYSFLVFVCEAENDKYFSDTTIEQYYGEAGSDLILALFCWANGAYKPAEFQLRSAIENFIKASLYSEKNDIITCKSVYEIMDFATSSDTFKNPICQQHLAKLKNAYSGLCAFVHSSPDKLSSEKALIQLPKYSKNNADEFTKNFQSVVNSLLSLLYFHHYTFIFSIHSINRELFFQGLTSTDKAAIYAEKTKDI